MTEINRRIERGLILWLREVRGIAATSAAFGETEKTELWGGCDTCGYNSSGGEFSFDIVYQREGHPYRSSTTVDGDPLGFFPELLPYIERANW